MKPSFRFTTSQDWFSGHIPTWEKLISHILVNIDHPPKALEIGTWEGRSAIYLLQTLCNDDRSELVCIDHFDLLQTQNGQARYDCFKHNIAIAEKAVRLIDDYSVPALYTLLAEKLTCPTRGFDFVYIDGSHEADDTFLDGELAWRLSCEGAIIIFDDYEWQSESIDSIHHPRRGIDAFLNLHQGEFKLMHQGYQIAIQKSSPQRIGFLSKQISHHIELKSLNYGMNIVLCSNEAYAMPTAVTLLSTIRATIQGRITFYIADCGLSELSKSRFYDLIPKVTNERITLNIIPMPSGSISLTDASWAKIEIIKHLPAERALLLDSDTFIRHDITQLWNLDLKGNVLAAALDVGYPTGPGNEFTDGYFNAGVLLLDLTRVRAATPSIIDVPLHECKLKYKDQDLLNTFFHGRWSKLDLEWNATGLGTYALQNSSQRAAIWSQSQLEKLHQDPKIVHFTGPLHPRMSAVLDPYNQPVAAKPWGYAGSPGHPFMHEWCACVRNTPWKEYFGSETRTLQLEKVKAELIDEGCKIFVGRLCSRTLS